jgi:formate hydrogenlyase subunit 4
VPMLEMVAKIALQMGLGLVFAPVLAGAVKKIKARLQHRQGPSLLQPWFDLRKLFRKRMVRSATTSWLFDIPPFLEFGVALFLLAVIAGPMALNTSRQFGVDLFFILYLLALGRFFGALAGLDAGSAFGGMGSSREMTIAAMVEPGLILTLFLLGFKAGNLNLNQIFGWAAADGGWFVSPLYLFSAGAFFMLLIAETGRIPVDNPDTHLELTMIHEGMILEYSGPYLALISWAAMIRQYLFYGIFVNLFWPDPPSTGIIPGVMLFLLKLLLTGLLVAITESSLAKMRLLKVPRLLLGAFALGLMGLVTVIF